MLFEADMLEVVVELFLADLTEIGVWGGLVKILVRRETVLAAGVLQAALKFFFELAFLEGSILLEVFLSG